MHLHGHDISILHEGPGYWDGVFLTNMQNPQRRDVQMLRPKGHIVIQYEADNSGVWPFHCHIAWHVSLVRSISPPQFRHSAMDRSPSSFIRVTVACFAEDPCCGHSPRMADIYVGYRESI